MWCPIFSLASSWLILCQPVFVTRWISWRVKGFLTSMEYYFQLFHTLYLSWLSRNVRSWAQTVPILMFNQIFLCSYSWLKIHIIDIVVQLSFSVLHACSMLACLLACLRACVRACVLACLLACVLACVRACVRAYIYIRFIERHHTYC